MSHHLLLAALLAGTVPLAAEAQVRAAPGSDFLFGHPRGTLTVRAGMTLARASSDFHDDARSFFTLERGDFDAPAVAVDLAFWASDRRDIVASASFGKASAESEYRDFVGTDDLPIRQSTELAQYAAAIGLRFFPWGRGESVGSLAWIPRRVAPYAGAAVGLAGYSLEQAGEFVTSDLDIVNDRLTASGWGPMGQLFAGLELGVTAQVALVGEARLVGALPGLGDDWSGYDNVDLSGLQTTLGVGLRF